MTKAIASVAAMQLVEQGKLKLEDPVPNIDPALGSPQVLEGFDAAGAPKLRPAKRPITLRHLLTHTAGFSYEIWDANTVRYVKASGMPSTATGKIASIRMPLAFDPGDKWEYGVNIDWVGRLVESISGQPLDVYFREKIFAPLGMKDSTATSPRRAARAPGHRAPATGRRLSRAASRSETPVHPRVLVRRAARSTRRPGTISTFLADAAERGSGNGARILRPETVALMGKNHIGDIRRAGVMKTRPASGRTTSISFPGPRSAGGWATCSTCSRGRTAEAPAR